MKCKECSSCRKGYFASKPEAYVCIGVKEPFVVYDINTECTEYPEKRNKEAESMSYEQTREQFLLALNSNAYIGICTCSDMKNVIEVLDKQIPTNVVCDGDDESDWVYCARCNEIIGINESVYDAFYDNNWEPIYCHKCGQSLVWK